MTTAEMIEQLTQFYEAAGFTNYYERELKGKSDDEIGTVYVAFVDTRSGDSE